MSRRPFSAGDADRRRLVVPREWSVEQAFVSYEFEDQDRQSDAASGLHFRDQRTGAVAFHREAWFGMKGGEHAVEEVVILGGSLCGWDRQVVRPLIFQRDGFQPSKGMRSGQRHAPRVSAQAFKLDARGEQEGVSL